MENTYIINKGYSVKYDLRSLLLCFDYFNHGIPLPTYLDFISVRKAFHHILRFLIIAAYYLKLYGFKYKIVTLNENSIVIFRGKGKWASTVRLNETNGKLKIVKTPFNKDVFLREKKFYYSYKDSPSKIKLPKCNFTSDCTIEIEFLKAKSFQRLINDGSVNFDEAINHYNNIKNSIASFYKKPLSLIHADLSPENIFIEGDTYYLIDFADSHISSYQYDLYILIRSILFSFNNRNVNNNIANYSLNFPNIARMLDLDINKVIDFEKQFKALDVKKHPEHMMNK